MLSKLFPSLTFRESYIEAPHQIDYPDNFSWDHEVDLVVAGFGGAGAAATIEGIDQGLDTMVLDRFAGGGSTNISGGIYYAGGGTSIQQQAGVEDSTDNMYNYLYQEVQGAVSDSTLKAFCDQSPENFQWMVDNGVPFDASFCPVKTSYPSNDYYFYYSGNEAFPPYSHHATPAARGHRAHQKGVSGNALFSNLKNAAEVRGAKIKTQTKVVSLLTNRQGNVIGLKALQMKGGGLAQWLHKTLDKLHILLRYGALFWPPLFNLFAALCEKLERKFGDYTYIRANKGVVLATGGFYSNQKMIEKYAPKYLFGSPLGTMGDDGSGIQMAEAVGATTALMDKVSIWRFINPPTSFVKGVLVGPTGKRICNEMLYGAQLGEQMMRDHNGIGWVIMDKETFRASIGDLTLKKGLWFHVFLGWCYRLLGRKKAHSLQEMADKIGVNRQTLLDTIREYNYIAKSDQQDPMGKPKDHMPPIGDGPYYAINASYRYVFVPCPSLTFGGLVVNEESGLVKHRDGHDIQGLYAAGRTAVGVPSQGYVSGLSIADCIFSGRRAARHAAGDKYAENEKISTEQDAAEGGETNNPGE